MAQSIDRRAFLVGASASAAAAAAAPFVKPSRAVAAGERLVVAVGQWGIETPFAWRSSQSEKTLWDCAYDPLIMAVGASDPNGTQSTADDTVAAFTSVGDAAGNRTSVTYDLT